MTYGWVSFFKMRLLAYSIDDSGATAIEYALIAALIGVGVIGGLNAVGGSSGGAWNDMASNVETTFEQ